MAKRHANTKDGIRRLNTRVYQNNGHFSVQLYSTVVYDETRDRIVLDNGGWITPTTVSRINQAFDHRGIDVGVKIIKGKMYFVTGDLSRPLPFDGNTFTLYLAAANKLAQKNEGLA